MSYRSWTEGVLKRWPQSRTSSSYRERLYQVAHGAQRICHLGCGYDKNNVTAPLRQQSEIVGVDLDERAGPKYHSPFWLANVEQLPFADQQFDLVCTEYLIEHVADPAAVLREAHRILAPGGRLVLVTPNLWSYKFLVSAATPYSFHKWLGEYRYRRVMDEDMFPTLYRANTIPQLKKLFKQTGFDDFELKLLSNGPTWFRGMPILFELGCVYHKLIEAMPMLEILRCGIVAEAVKAGRKQPLARYLAVRCLYCGHDKMVQHESVWSCPRCKHSYPVRNNMIYVASKPQPPRQRQPPMRPALQHAST